MMIEIQEPKFKIGDKVKFDQNDTVFEIIVSNCTVGFNRYSKRMGEWLYRLYDTNTNEFYSDVPEIRLQLVGQRSTPN